MRSAGAGVEGQLQGFRTSAPSNLQRLSHLGQRASLHMSLSLRSERGVVQHSKFGRRLGAMGHFRQIDTLATPTPCLLRSDCVRTLGPQRNVVERHRFGLRHCSKRSAEPYAPLPVSPSGDEWNRNTSAVHPKGPPPNLPAALCLFWSPRPPPTTTPPP